MLLKKQSSGGAEALEQSRNSWGIATRTNVRECRHYSVPFEHVLRLIPEAREEPGAAE